MSSDGSDHIETRKKSGTNHKRHPARSWMFTFIKHGRKISVTRHLGTAKYFPNSSHHCCSRNGLHVVKRPADSNFLFCKARRTSNFFQMHLCSRNIKFSGKMHTSATFIKSTRASAHFSSSTRHCWLNDDSNHQGKLDSHGNISSFGQRKI